MGHIQGVHETHPARRILTTRNIFALHTSTEEIKQQQLARESNSSVSSLGYFGMMSLKASASTPAPLERLMSSGGSSDFAASARLA